MTTEAKQMLYDVVDGVLDERAEIDVYLAKVRKMYSPSRGYPAEYRAASRIADKMIDEWMELAKKAVAALEHAFKGAGKPVAISMANVYRTAKEPAGTWIVLEALKRALGISAPVIAFQYATVGGDTVPGLVNYARKKKWGDVVDLMDDPNPKKGIRVWASIHDDNPYRILTATRNEMKWALPRERRRLVQRAYRETKKDFVSALSAEDEAAIADSLGMTVEQFRQAAKKGSAEIAGTLAAARISRSASGTDKRDERGEITGLPYARREATNAAR